MRWFVIVASSLEFTQVWNLLSVHSRAHHHVSFCRGLHPGEKPSLHLNIKTVCLFETIWKSRCECHQKKLTSLLSGVPLLHLSTAGVGELRYRQHWNPISLQRAPGQPAVSSKRDRNNLLRFVINIEAGGGKPCAAADTEPGSDWCPWTDQPNMFLTVFPFIPKWTRRASTCALLHGGLSTSSHTRTGQTHDYALTACRSAVAPSQQPIRWEGGWMERVYVGKRRRQECGRRSGVGCVWGGDG